MTQSPTPVIASEPPVIASEARQSMPQHDDEISLLDLLQTVGSSRGTIAQLAHQDFKQQITGGTMPTISMFYGILVSMYALDIQKHHSPHIHIRYAEFRASIEIPNGDVLEGTLPAKQMKLVQAWIALHADELMADWELASTGETPYKIAPLR